MLLTIFDIQENKYIGGKWVNDVHDFGFTDNENFSYKYRVPQEYANQENSR